jgi:hypothetical protein
MDKRPDQEGKGWGWLPAHMPRVQRLLADRRRTDGADHVRLCWQMGVVQQQPGWFFAREGPLAVGTVWPEVADTAGWSLAPDQAIVILRPVEQTDGA